MVHMVFFWLGVGVFPHTWPDAFFSSFGYAVRVVLRSPIGAKAWDLLLIKCRRHFQILLVLLRLACTYRVVPSKLDFALLLVKVFCIHYHRPGRNSNIFSAVSMIPSTE